MNIVLRGRSCRRSRRRSVASTSFHHKIERSQKGATGRATSSAQARGGSREGCIAELESLANRSQLRLRQQAANTHQRETSVNDPKQSGDLITGEMRSNEGCCPAKGVTRHGTQISPRSGAPQQRCHQTNEDETLHESDTRNAAS